MTEKSLCLPEGRRHDMKYESVTDFSGLSSKLTIYEYLLTAPDLIMLFIGWVLHYKIIYR